MSRSWRVRLAQQAEFDLFEIFKWSKAEGIHGFEPTPSVLDPFGDFVTAGQRHSMR
jgi:hypothetical protein